MSMMERGQKARLEDIGCDSSFSVQVAIAAGGPTIDVACFGLDSESTLADERYMVFFNQPAAPENAIRLESSGNTSTFHIDVSKLPEAVERLVLAASIDGDGTMKQLGASSVSLGTGRFAFSGTDFDTEKAVIVGEIYRRDGGWRFGAVGQGFAGGLSALLAYFGGTEEASADAPVAPVAPAAPAPAAPAGPKPVVLSKVTLTKPGERHTVSLVKGPGAPAKLLIKATWVDNGDGNDGNDDLDVRVGILMPNGKMAFICAPDRSGKLDAVPFVFHTGDVRKASVKEPASEGVEVNPAISQLLGGRVGLVFSVYSAVSNGAVSVASLKPTMRMEYGDQVIECAFDFSTTKAAKSSCVYTYVIGTAVIDGNQVHLTPSGQTSRWMSEATPWLEWDRDGALKVTMDGPAVFKGRPFKPGKHGRTYV
jgi:tellurite resistance protein TerA